MKVMFLSVMFIVHHNSAQREGVMLAAYPGTPHFTSF